MTENPFPTVGSMVHYIGDYAAHHAAMVIHVNGDNGRDVWLRVFQPGEHDYEKRWVNQGDERGTWHWPEA